MRGKRVSCASCTVENWHLRQGPLVDYPCAFPMTSYLWALLNFFTVPEGPDVEELK